MNMRDRVSRAIGTYKGLKRRDFPFFFSFSLYRDEKSSLKLKCSNSVMFLFVNLNHLVGQTI